MKYVGGTFFVYYAVTQIHITGSNKVFIFLVDLKDLTTIYEEGLKNICAPH